MLQSKFFRLFKNKEILLILSQKRFNFFAQAEFLFSQKGYAFKTDWYFWFFNVFIYMIYYLVFMQRILQFREHPLFENVALAWWLKKRECLQFFTAWSLLRIHFEKTLEQIIKQLSFYLKSKI